MTTAPDPNWTDQTIWTGDNLDIMRGMNSAKADLTKIVRRVRISCLLKGFEVKTGKCLGAVGREGIAHAAGEAIGHAVAVFYPSGADQWAENGIDEKLDIATDLKYKLAQRVSYGQIPRGPAVDGRKTEFQICRQRANRSV